MMRAAMIADTVSAASSIRSYSASIVRRAAGRGTSLSSTSVMMPERAFRADEEILHRVAGDVLHARAAEPRDPAVRQHDLEGHDVVARHAVLEAAQPAGVLGDVAADGADALRSGIGRIKQAVSRRRLVDALRDGAGLRAKRQIARIDVEDRDPSASGRGPGCPCCGTLPPLSPVPEPRVTIGVPTRGRQSHARGHLLGRAREHDRRRPLSAAPPCRRSCTESRSSARVRTASAPTMEASPSCDRVRRGMRLARSQTPVPPVTLATPAAAARPAPRRRAASRCRRADTPAASCHARRRAACRS